MRPARQFQCIACVARLGGIQGARQARLILGAPGATFFGLVFVPRWQFLAVHGRAASVREGISAYGDGCKRMRFAHQRCLAARRSDHPRPFEFLRRRVIACGA